MLDYLLLALVGCGLGVVTGLTPGLHVNTVCLIGLGLYASLGLDAVGFGAAMVAMSLTHTFLDFIPAIFLGVPEEETALSVLPAHQLVHSGRALEAVKLTAYGSLMGLAFALLLLAPAILVLPSVYGWIRGFVVWIIAAAALLLVAREKGWGKRIWALTILALSGILGIISLDLPSISATHVLFPVFAGLFGLSGILYSMKSQQTHIPQKPTARVKVEPSMVGSGFLGAVGGMVVGVLPAMSPSQVGILMSGLFGSSARRFLVSVSAINTSDAIFSLVSLYTIHNARSGVAVMLGRVLELDAPTMFLYVGVFAFSACIAYAAHMWVGKRAARWFGRADYRLLSGGVLAFILALVWIFTGWLGLLIGLVSTAIGLLPIMSGVSRTHLMGVLLVPTMLFFWGFR